MPFDEEGNWVRPDWLPEREWTPAQEWGRITGRQDPYWRARQPMRQLGRRLQARYLLGVPQMSKGAWEVEPTFEDYVGGFMGGGRGAWQATSYDDLDDPNSLLARARLAAASTVKPMGEYMAGFDKDTEDWYRAAWYGSMFNPTETEQAAANQLAVATMLAQQRQGGGAAYGGAMGRAIANAMARQQQYRQDIGQPEESFLDWYLGPGPAPTT